MSYTAMAYGSLPTESETKCQLCDENDVHWKCLMCDELICDSCKKSHLRSKASRNHQIIPIDSAEIQQHGGEFDIISKCEIHPKENIQMYCDQCQVLMCRDCVIDKTHQHHTLCKLEDIVQRQRSELSEIIDVSKQKLSTCEDAITFIQANRTDYSEDTSIHITEIKERNENIKDKLDRITEDFIKKLQQREAEDQDKLKIIENEKKEHVSGLKEFITKCEETQTLQEIQMVRSVNDLKCKAASFKSCEAPDPLHSPSVTIRETGVQELKALFGNLDFEEEEASDYEETSPPIFEEANITSTFSFDASVVAAFDDNHVLVGCTGQRDINLITVDGQIIKTYKTGFKMFDMAVTDSGVLFLTLVDSKKVKQLTGNGRFMDFYVAPVGYKATGITVTDDSKLVVCLVNHEQTYDSRLIILSLEGELISTIHHDADSHNPLFCEPAFVSSNRNGDLLVSQPSVNVVLGIDATGHRKFTYSGQRESLNKLFRPLFTVTDQYGHIFISDFENSAIHLLDADGNFLKLILTEKDGLLNPRGMSVDNFGRLWVCSAGNENIIVATYV